MYARGLEVHSSRPREHRIGCANHRWARRTANGHCKFCCRHINGWPFAYTSQPKKEKEKMR